MTDAAAPDPHTTAGKLAELRSRLDEAIHAGSARAVEKQHAKGKMTARERIDYLLDDDSFTELDELSRHRSTRFGMEKNRPYGDAVVTGLGTIHGRQVAIYSQDFTIFGGALGEVFAEKIHKLMDMAQKVGAPLIGINDASTFWGFCQGHDSSTFAPLETRSFGPTDEQVFLLAFPPAHEGLGQVDLGVGDTPQERQNHRYRQPQG